ncbi:hypothetical protein ACH49O_40705 [Streptomyces coeruleorubidus]
MEELIGHDHELSFNGATFSGSYVLFDGATFSDGEVAYTGATFSAAA